MRRLALVILGLVALTGAALAVRLTLSTPEGQEASATEPVQSSGTMARGPHQQHELDTGQLSTDSSSPAASSGVVTARFGRWSDPETWRGKRLPGAGDRVIIAHETVLDRDVRVSGVVVTSTGVLSFDSDKSVALETSANVVVDGVLRMHPANAVVEHLLRFVDVDESKFVGGGHGPIETDVGLWVDQAGRLDLQGSPRSGWLRSAEGLPAGSRAVSLQTVPTGWRLGDEVVVTPTSPPITEGFSSSFSLARVSSAAGLQLTLDTGLANAHPLVNGTWGSEVANLTRNVHIEGTPSGRAHIWIRSSKPQIVNYAALRYLGPRKPADDGVGTQPVLARYALHFHLAQDGSRGSQVVGTVVRDAGGHAFAPHASHGITFRDTVSFNTFEDAYWWDLAPDTRTPGPETDGTTIDHAMAALVKSDPDYRGYRLAGFSIAQGRSNTIRDSVAVGVQGAKGAAGFAWPESGGSTSQHGVWEFAGNTAHNNAINGVFVWQNDQLPHVVQGLVAYHNGASGIEHGAYVSSFHYIGGSLFGNLRSAIDLHAVDAGPPGLRFDNLTLDGGGVSDYLIVSYDHQTDGTGDPTVVRCADLKGARIAAVWISDSGDNADHDLPNALVFQGSRFSTPAEVIMTSSTPAGNVVRIEGDGVASVVRPDGRATEPSLGPAVACPIR